MIIIFFLILFLIFFIYSITCKFDEYLPLFMLTENIRQSEADDNIDSYILNNNIKILLENELNNINNVNNDLTNNLKLLNNILTSNSNTINILSNELKQIQELINNTTDNINNIDSKYFLTTSLRPLLILDQVHNKLQNMLSYKIKYDIIKILITNKLLFKNK